MHVSSKRMFVKHHSDWVAVDDVAKSSISIHYSTEKWHFLTLVPKRTVSIVANKIVFSEADQRTIDLMLSSDKFDFKHLRHIINNTYRLYFMPAVLKDTVCTHKITRLAIDRSTGRFWVRLQGLDCYVSGKQILSSKIVHAREAQFITVPVPDSWELEPVTLIFQDTMR